MLSPDAIPVLYLKSFCRVAGLRPPKLGEGLWSSTKKSGDIFVGGQMLSPTTSPEAVTSIIPQRVYSQTLHFASTVKIFFMVPFQYWSAFANCTWSKFPLSSASRAASLVSVASNMSYSSDRKRLAAWSRSNSRTSFFKGNPPTKISPDFSCLKIRAWAATRSILLSVVSHLSDGSTGHAGVVFSFFIS